MVLALSPREKTRSATKPDRCAQHSLTVLLCVDDLSIGDCAGVVLEIKFPSGIQLMFDFLSLLAINLKSILQVECLGNLSFCASLAVACTVA